MRELRLWYYLECPEKIEMLLDQTDDILLLDLDQFSRYIAVIEGCE